MTTLTQQEFAATLGKNKSYVTRLKQAGRLVMTADGMVDMEASQARIKATADPSRQDAAGQREAERETMPPPESKAQPSQPDAIGNSYQTARAVKEKYLALRAKLDYEEASKKLVSADEARLFAADLAATFRSAIEILKDRAAPEIAQLKSSEEVHSALGEHCEHILRDLADKIKKWGTT